MKRVISFLCCMVLLVGWLGMCCPVNAAEADGATNEVLVSETVEVLPDGTVITISVYETPVQTRASSYHKSGKKTYTGWDSSGNKLWTLTVHGGFTVNEGVSATCAAATRSYGIYNDAWHYVTSSAYASGSSAIADGEFCKKALGITVETKTAHVVLTCDKYGNLS